MVDGAIDDGKGAQFPAGLGSRVAGPKGAKTVVMRSLHRNAEGERPDGDIADDHEGVRILEPAPAKAIINAFGLAAKACATVIPRFPG